MLDFSFILDKFTIFASEENFKDMNLLEELESVKKPPLR